MEDARIIVRPAKQSDNDFIFNSWLTGQYYGDWHYSQMPKDLFFLKFKTRLEAILSQRDTEVRVAVLEDDPDMILAYQVSLNDILHWAYTKSDYRGKSLQNLLARNKVFKTSTAITKPGAAILKKKQITFNPWG